jgi:hypothetical protein
LLHAQGQKVNQGHRQGPVQRDITFFYTDKVERQTTAPVAEEAARRGYQVRFTADLGESAEIGFYCHHSPSSHNSRFSAVMLHDLAQRHDIWPAFWQAEPWNQFDLGFLPGPSWGERWKQTSARPEGRTRRGVYQLGWPKCDALFNNRARFADEAQALRRELGLRHELSILYAPSWENHGKQDDFVRALRDLPVNLLLKQAPWSDSYPEVLANIAQMNALHRDAGENVHIISPDVGIIHCLAISDVMVSDESSVLIEALLLDVPGVAVMDWLIPDSTPPRMASVPFDFVIKTRRDALRTTVDDILARRADYQNGMASLRERHFSSLGQSAACMMDVVDACIEGRRIPHEPLIPNRAAGFAGFKELFATALPRTLRNR